MADELYDILIIGGGPAGGTAALYTSRAGLRVLVLDRPGRSGSLAATEHVANYPGMPGPVSGAEIVRTIREQARVFGAEFREEVAVGADLTGEPKVVFTAEGNAFQARAVIIATGALERKVKIPGEEEFLGRGVSECATCDAAFYRDKTAIVAGGDDHAALEALALARMAARVVFATPTGKPLISPHLLAELHAHPTVELQLGWRLKAVIGDDHVRGAQFLTADGPRTLEADGVFLYLGGAKPTTSFLNQQLPLNDDGAIITNVDYSTAVPGVYAIGDAIARHVKQAVVAVGEGCMAALAVERDLRGREKIALDYK